MVGLHGPLVVSLELVVGSEMWAKSYILGLPPGHTYGSGIPVFYRRVRTVVEGEVNGSSP